MKTIEIKALKRPGLGKKETKKLRKDGNVPCVMYGGEEIIHFYAPELTFKDIIYTPNVYIINLDIEGKTYMAALQEIQYHPVSDSPIHIDFIQVFEDRPVTMSIPVSVTGVAPGIKAGGKLRLKRRSLKVKGSFKDLPDTLVIDISKLDIGMSIKVHELSYENLEILDPQRAMVVAVISSRMAVKEAATGEEGEESEEGAEGEGAGTEGAQSPAEDSASEE
ncbi:MAG: 50S ribosomal protein L25/general stress protein Ctc [Marinilabiliaceae bacterium]|jgi:large subunit ribosomal protein L25|nr:50S ribosomal protein L25/general stress protein Ctc [Marinilabiliaceae bacterium]